MAGLRKLAFVLNFVDEFQVKFYHPSSGSNVSVSSVMDPGSPGTPPISESLCCCLKITDPTL